MKRILFISFLSLVWMQMAQGQTLKAYIEAAEEAMAAKDYYSALTFYETALEVEEDRIDLKYKLAEAARNYMAYEIADSLYREVAASDEAENYPLVTYYIGSLKQTLGNYQEAIDQYQIYISENEGTGDSLHLAMAEKNIASSQWAIEQFQLADDSTTVERLDATVNTVYSEFSPNKGPDRLYYSSLSFQREVQEKEKEPEIPAKLYTRVMESVDSTNGVPLDEQLNDKSRHTAHLTFNRDSTRAYFTLCEYVNRSDIRCNIYFKDIRDSVWGEATILPEPINMLGYTSTEPHVIYDDYHGKEVLYFVSDREGGKGKLDIWYSVINDENSFTEPENLGDINSEGDDLSPFYHEASSVMYFSSDGYLGFGNYDVYSSQRDSLGNWSDPENLGSNINTSFDEAFYVLSEDESEGYFSSNRYGSLYLEASRKACCYDIYKVTNEPVEVKLIVETYNKRTLEPLNNVTLYIEQKNGEVIQITQTTGDSNSVTMPLKRNKHYTVVGEKFGYDNDTATFNTYNITKSQDIVKKLYLDVSEITLQVVTYEKRTRVPLPNVTVTLTNQSNDEKEVKTNERSNITYFTLNPGNDYGINGKRKGYRQAEAFVSQAELLDVDTLVKELYLELGNLEEFLPLAIYFDNDVPDPRSKKPITDLTYLETYQPYYDAKDEFKRKFAKSEATEEEAEAAIEEFFERNLRKSKEEFESFLNILHQYLDEGLSFKIYLKGYTSPLASASYNYQLGQRRIKTIQNQFKVFRGGVLMEYFDSGDLEVLEKSFGEDTSPTGISDDKSDPAKSIYSPKASKERRVEIIEIQKDNPQQ